ncbi:hypothetical protein LTR85_009268 [Meristemomyces frigidus]|nr:hypothetical protein LTR85_009268 [Meristemomyces frigidus]
MNALGKGRGSEAAARSPFASYRELSQLAYETAESIKATFPTQLNAYKPSYPTEGPPTIPLWLAAWLRRCVGLYDSLRQFLLAWTAPLPLRGQGLETMQQVARLVILIGNTVRASLLRDLGPSKLRQASAQIIELGLGFGVGDLEDLPKEIRLRIFHFTLRSEFRFRCPLRSDMASPIRVKGYPDPRPLRLSRQIKDECFMQAAVELKIVFDDLSTVYGRPIAVPPIWKSLWMKNHVQYNLLLRCHHIPHSDSTHPRHPWCIAASRIDN